MTHLRILLALGLVCGAACKPELEEVAFDQRETLPGFSIALPAGKRVKSEVAPAAGQIVVEQGGAVVTIGWQAGRMPKEELGAIAGAMRTMVGTPADAVVETVDATVPSPNYGTELLIPTDKRVLLAITVVQCVASNVTVTLATMAAPERERARAFHERLVQTLECGSEASAMRNDLGLPSFDLGESIAYLPGSDPPAYFSLTGSRWYVTPGVPMSRAAFEQPEAVAAMMRGFGIEVLEQTVLPATDEWLQLQLKVSIEGESGFMLAGVLTCADSAYTVVHTAGDLSAPTSAELQRVKCPAERVDAATLPTVADRFGRACDGGNGLACEAFAMLAEEEPTRLSGHDPAKLRARACELGQAHLCAPR